jgi:hypothetical protein
MSTRGFDTTSLPDVIEAAELILSWQYHLNFQWPLTFKTLPKIDRNSEVFNLYMHGWSVPKLSREYSISKPRVYQILKAARRGHVS